MDFMIYCGEACNLQCKYCEKKEDRDKRLQFPNYTSKQLRNFLEQFDNLNIHFYGGEPLLNMDLIDFILNNFKIDYCTLATNGLLLDRLSNFHLSKIHQIALSIDGSKDATDKYRGIGVHDKILSQAFAIKNRFKGKLSARMTITPGLDIEKELKHLLFHPINFDSIHWQLNVLFHKDDWLNNKDLIINWFKNDYNPKISNLVNFWKNEIINNHNVLQIVPFTGIMNSLLTNSRVHNVRCGAGWDFWVINTDGNISLCPVMRFNKKYTLGNFKNLKPSDFKHKFLLKDPCSTCNYLSLCGGRCLYANLENQWDNEGFNLVCDSIKHLIKELKRVYIDILPLFNKGIIKISDFQNFHDFEVIP